VDELDEVVAVREPRLVQRVPFQVGVAGPLDGAGSDEQDVALLYLDALGLGRRLQVVERNGLPEVEPAALPPLLPADVE